MTFGIDHPFSHSVRLPKINEWAAEGKWLTRTTHKFADPDLLKFCLPNAKLHTLLLHSVYILPKSPFEFPPLNIAPPRRQVTVKYKRRQQKSLFSADERTQQVFLRLKLQILFCKNQDSECWVTFIQQY